jgi:hypothetical protein
MATTVETTTGIKKVFMAPPILNEHTGEGHEMFPRSSRQGKKNSNQ